MVYVCDNVDSKVFRIYFSLLYKGITMENSTFASLVINLFCRVQFFQCSYDKSFL